jgi:hypothetical protein
VSFSFICCSCNRYRHVLGACLTLCVTWQHFLTCTHHFFSGFEANNLAIAHKYHTIWQLLIFLTVICGRFEDMDLPCRMHQSCTSHDSPPAPSDKGVSCSFVLLPVQMFTAFFSLFFFCLSCYISYVCLAPTSYICLSLLLLSLLLPFVFCLAPFPQPFLLHFFCLSSSIIFLSLLLCISSLSCSISSFCLSSILHSRLTRLSFSFSPHLSKSVFIFSKLLSVSLTFNLSQSLPISQSLFQSVSLAFCLSLELSHLHSHALSIFLSS